jgi:hypothetical protein
MTVQRAMAGAGEARAGDVWAVGAGDARGRFVGDARGRFEGSAPCAYSVVLARGVAVAGAAAVLELGRLPEPGPDQKRPPC